MEERSGDGDLDGEADRRYRSEERVEENERQSVELELFERVFLLVPDHEEMTSSGVERKR